MVDVRAFTGVLTLVTNTPDAWDALFWIFTVDLIKWVFYSSNKVCYFHIDFWEVKGSGKADSKLKLFPPKVFIYKPEFWCGYGIQYSIKADNRPVCFHFCFILLWYALWFLSDSLNLDCFGSGKHSKTCLVLMQWSILLNFVQPHWLCTNTLSEVMQLPTCSSTNCQRHVNAPVQAKYDNGYQVFCQLPALCSSIRCH